MQDLTKELLIMKKELDDIVKLCDKNLKNPPKGYIKTSVSNQRNRYYYRESKEEQWVYLLENKKDNVKEIIQKDYYQKLRSIAKCSLMHVNSLIKRVPSIEITNCYENASEGRKVYIDPVMEGDDLYIQRWLSEKYIKREFFKNDVEIFTERGERVMSKSEKIIADMLNKRNVPYLYEPPLHLDGYGKVHPDFKVLNVRMRKEMYWEHFGMMDNLEYMDKALKKIELYQKNGYVIGSNLIVTHETSNRPINIKGIMNIIDSLLV